METRILGRTGRKVSVVGLGCWQLGSDWGSVGDTQALAVVRTALESGVTFLDTADVYGDGRSEQLVARAVADWSGERPTIATKMGRRATPHVPDAYTLTNFREWTDRSRRNLAVDTLDLVQLHCPPPQCYDRNEVFDALDTLVAEGAIANYGVSVETCDEALAALRRPNLATIQIILNVFRRKPLERVLPTALEQGVGIIARVPLASGMLSGKYDESTQFAPDDHRNFNRHGEAFDVGETFSGVPYAEGIVAARKVAQIAAGLPGSPATAALALRWIIDQPGATTVIPGARTPEQSHANAAAADLAPLDASTLKALEAIYDSSIRASVHDRW